MPASEAARRRATTRLLAARLPAKLRLESSRPNSGLRQSAASPARPAQTPLPLELLACLAIEPSRIVQAQPVQAIESMPAVAAPGNACAPEGAAPGPAAHRTWRRTRSQRHPTTAKHRPLRTAGQDRSSILWRMLVFPAAFAHRLRSQPRPGGRILLESRGKRKWLAGRAKRDGTGWRIRRGWLLTKRVRPVPSAGGRARYGARVFRSGRPSRIRTRPG